MMRATYSSIFAWDHYMTIMQEWFQTSFLNEALSPLCHYNAQKIIIRALPCNGILILSITIYRRLLISNRQAPCNDAKLYPQGAYNAENKHLLSRTTTAFLVYSTYSFARRHSLKNMLESYSYIATVHCLHAKVKIRYTYIWAVPNSSLIIL